MRKQAIGIFVTLWFVSWAIFLAGPSLSQAQEVIAIEGGTLIDGNGGPPVPDSLIIIRGNRIETVSRRGQASYPPGATVIDASGKTIIPGLVDGHIHLRNNMQPLFLYWGVTTVVDYRNVTSWLWAEKDAVEKGAVVGPNIFIHYPLDSLHPEAQRHIPEGWSSERWGLGSGPEGRRVSMDLYSRGNADRRWVSDEASLQAAILEAKQAGFDAIQFYQSIPVPLIKKGVEIAHRHGLPAIGQYTSPAVRRGIDEMIDTGIDVHVEMHGIEFATASKADQEALIREQVNDGKGGIRSLGSHFMNPSEFPALVQQMVSRQMYLAPTLAHYYQEISRYREEFDRFNTTFLEGPVGLLAPGREDLLKWNKPYKDPVLREKRAVGYRKIGEFLKLFVDQGGKLIASTGAPSGGSPGVSLHNEIRMYRESGLTPMQAIQAATIWPMQAYRKDKELGSIEAGKRADLVVLNRNPLDDISATRDIHMVIKSGKIVDREGLAQWKDPFPRPQPGDDGVLRIPLVDEISPFSLPVHKGGSVPEVIVRGGNFTPDCRVMFNDQFVPTKYYDSGRLGITIKPSMLKEPGTYPISVVQPGSGGGISNLWYFYVTY